MNWQTAIITIIPLIKPLILLGLAAGFTFLGKKLYDYVIHNHKEAFAKMVVSALEDIEKSTDGQAKLAIAISKFTSKWGVDEKEAKDYISAAYINFIKPLDTLKSPLVVSSTTSEPISQ